ncbi:MAG: capsular polysaccharide biosynthesis protein, partial [Campylobacterota bacterium]|nr:capsular polysaccharide biosynthesis protein [Campylobacterota bacterium]
MTNYTISKQLIKNTKNFLDIKYYSIIDRFLGKSGVFYGWGRKKSGNKAIELSKKDNISFRLLEDGFIRSLGLGVDKSPTFSIVEDDIGIYYDATTSSKLENILNNYDFKSDENLISEAKKAIALIKTHHISKYNNSIDIKENYFNSKDEKRVLIIAQTAGDSSLKYGMLDDFTTEDMIKDALLENIDSGIYLKVHPDVLSGKKSSDIDIKSLDKRVKVITENLNPISLLKKFDKVYTKTSGMGMEALIVGCKCVCYGMPYYAGWGITIDK